MISRDYSISLLESLAVLPDITAATADDPLDELTQKLASWQHTTAAKGGNWEGEGVFDSELVTSAEMQDFLMTALSRRVSVARGGMHKYRGRIVEVAYSTKGQTMVRSLLDRANRVKVMYTKVGPQLLQNGDVEGGAWTQVGTPSTHETTTDWFAKGTTAMHVITDAGGEGTEIEDSSGGTPWSVVANQGYSCGLIIKLVSGTWSLTVYQSDGSTVLAQRDTAVVGRSWLQCRIPDTSTYAGTIIIRLTCASAAEEIYADGAIFRTAPVRAETEWVEDTDSILIYDEMEGVFAGGEMTDDEADARAQLELAERAWPRTEVQQRGDLSMIIDEDDDPPDELKFNCLGPVWGLSLKHTLQDGTDQADNHITALLDESAYITSDAAIIDTNTTEVLIESTRPQTLWSAIEKVLEAGDGSGAQWMGGVYPVREFRFEARPTDLQYELRDGIMREYLGGPVDPLEFNPGWCLLADLPLLTGDAALGTVDDPRRVFLEETRFVDEGGRLSIGWSQGALKR